MELEYNSTGINDKKTLHPLRFIHALDFGTATGSSRKVLGE